MSSTPRGRIAAATALALFAAACGDASTALRDDALTPSSKPSLGYALPYGCTDSQTCAGTPGDGKPHTEQVQVCKQYPAGVAGVPVQVTMRAVTLNGQRSILTNTYTLQPGECRIVWQNGEQIGPLADTVYVTEQPVAGYTTTSQVTTIARIGPRQNPSGGEPMDVQVLPSSTDNPVKGVVGGPQIPGYLVVFTNTPIPPQPGAIGNFVWNDLNANGVQDAGEPGIQGVTVTLSNGQSAVTDANGAYAITNIPAGNYTVTVSTPNGFFASPTGAGTTATDNNGSGTPVTVVAGATDNTIDFGFYKKGAIGDFVWNDANANGIQDNGEPGIGGVTVTLSNGTTTTTDGTGHYAFTNLLPGTYTVSVTLPNGCVASPTGKGNTNNDSNANGSSATIANGNTDNSIDFGCYYVGSIGDFVWNDLNGNGIQDAGEPGLAGVTVSLSNGQTTTTNASGVYGFSNLLAGNYTVTVATPNGFNASPSNVGPNDAVDSDGSGIVVSVNGNTDLSIDFGFVAIPTTGPGCTLTQGYWKNHEEDWAAPYAPTAPWLDATHKVAGVTWDGLMSMPPKGGNSYLQLAHQWIAATLNKAAGASMSPSVVSTLNAAGAWLIANTPANATSVPSIKSSQAEAWMSTLDSYNNGKLGTPHCN